MRMLTVCGTQGCPTLIPSGKGYCPEHRREVDRDYRRQREAEGTARGLVGRERDEVRRRILREQGGVCASCGRKPFKGQLDHVVRLKDGGGDDRSNLQVLCVPCHQAKTTAERG